MLKLIKYRSNFLQILLIASVLIFTSACSDGTSSNSDSKGSDSTNAECSDGFGDASRCEVREGL